jgi:hypothetical protein
VVSPDGGAIDEGHAERDAALLDKVEQVLPHALLGPADEELCRQPPRAEFGRNAAPLGPVLMPPDDRRDGPSQLLRRCLAAGPHRLDQRLPDRPDRIRENLNTTTFCHAQNIEIAFKL